MLAQEEMAIEESQGELRRRGENEAETTVRHHVNGPKDAMTRDCPPAGGLRVLREPADEAFLPRGLSNRALVDPSETDALEDVVAESE